MRLSTNASFQAVYAQLEMPIIGRFKNLFRGGQNGSIKRPFPDAIKYDVDPFNDWSVVGSLGDGAFGTVQKVCRIGNPQIVAAAKVKIKGLKLS